MVLNGDDFWPLGVNVCSSFPPATASPVFMAMVLPMNVLCMASNELPHPKKGPIVLNKNNEMICRKVFEMNTEDFALRVCTIQ